MIEKYIRLMIYKEIRVFLPRTSLPKVLIYPTTFGILAFATSFAVAPFIYFKSKIKT